MFYSPISRARVESAVERPVGFFGLGAHRYHKKEIDISVFRPDKATKIAIELKFPRNGQYPEQMFKACQDIAFLEQIVMDAFDRGYFIIAAEDHGFWQGNQNGIYGYFRGNEPIHGQIMKPTGKKDEMVDVRGSYKAAWGHLPNISYSIVAVGGEHTKSV